MANNLNEIVKYSQNNNIVNRMKELLNDEAPIFITSVLNISRANQMLQECSPDSVWGAAMKAASLKLPIEPSLGYAYVIPYKNKGGAEAQFQLGYKGLLQLAIRSGQYKSIYATAVYADEIESYHPVTNELKLKKNPDDFKLRYDSRAKPVGYYARLELLSGFSAEVYMTVKAVEAHGKRFSKSFTSQSSPWTTDFDAMAEKTVLKKLLGRYGILSIQMQKALVDEDESETSPNVPDETPEETKKPKKSKQPDVVDAVVNEPDAPVEEEKDPYE